MAKKIVKTPAKKSVAKSVKKATPAKKVVAKKVVAKKVAPVKKVVAKKVAAKKTTSAKKVVAKKVVAKKAAPAKKAVVKKVAAKKTVPAKKAVVKKVVAKKAAPAKKVVAKKAVPAKKIVAKKVVEKKATPVKKVLVKKTATNFPKVRYSDEDLKFFKNLILDKLAKAKDDYDMLRKALSNSDSFGVEDTSPSFSSVEEGASSLIREENGLSAHRLYKYIESLEKALVRIENKTYGISRLSGKLIPKERLILVPHATLTAEEKNSR